MKNIIMQGIKQDDFYYSGNLKLLEKNPISIFCSKEIPLSIYYPSNELFLKMLSLPIVLVSGWQSAMEKRMLKNYNGFTRAQIIYFLSKGIKNFTLPSYLKKPYNEGHLLVLSPYLEEKGISFKRVQGRDKLILRLIDRYLFFYINQGGYLETIYKKCLERQKSIYLLKHHLNADYINDKVKLIEEANVECIVYDDACIDTVNAL